MAPIKKFMEIRECEDKDEKAMWKNCACFFLIKDELFKRSFPPPLLKCVSKEQAEYILKDLHKGVWELHLGGRSMTT